MIKTPRLTPSEIRERNFCIQTVIETAKPGSIMRVCRLGARWCGEDLPCDWCLRTRVHEDTTLEDVLAEMKFNWN